MSETALIVPDNLSHNVLARLEEAKARLSDLATVYLVTEVSQLYYPYTDNLNLSYYWLGWIIKPRHRCRQVAGSTCSREREFMSTPVLPPRL